MRSGFKVPGSRLNPEPKGIFPGLRILNVEPLRTRKKYRISSLRRRPESIRWYDYWIPASAGMTLNAVFGHFTNPSTLNPEP
jgi:hypothetical protein